MSVSDIIKRALRYIVKGVPNNIVRPQISPISCSAKLQGEKIVVTGGGRGLGLEMARRFKHEGADVLIIGRSEDTLLKASAEVGCKYLTADISDVKSSERIIRECIEILGGVDCLVNNAGMSLHEDDYLEVTSEGWDKQFDTNLKGPYFLTQRLVKYFLDSKKRGNILFISSETGDTCDIRPYGFTKAAVNSVVQGLAFRYKLNGIRINALAPGITASEMTGVGKDGNLYAGDYGSGRFYLPEEVAEVATFLLSPASSCISGQIITCNNAQTVNARWKK